MAVLAKELCYAGHTGALKKGTKSVCPQPTRSHLDRPLASQILSGRSRALKPGPTRCQPSLRLQKSFLLVWHPLPPPCSSSTSQRSGQCWHSQCLSRLKTTLLFPSRDGRSEVRDTRASMAILVFRNWHRTDCALAKFLGLPLCPVPVPPPSTVPSPSPQDVGVLPLAGSHLFPRSLSVLCCAYHCLPIWSLPSETLDPFLAPAVLPDPQV